MARNSEYGFYSVNNSNDTMVLDRVEETETTKEKNAVDLEEARARMQRNLDKLLHYDLYERQEQEAKEKAQAQALTESPVIGEVSSQETVENTVEQVSAVDSATLEEDIQPTSTTMQFGDGEVQKTYQQDMQRGEKESSYKLNKKGKILILCYAVAVAVIMTLIILNTSVLAKISTNYQQKTAELSYLMEQNAEINEKIYDVSNDQYISGIAENELNMIQK